MLLLHEYTECWLYHSLMNDEPLPEARKLWEDSLSMEIEHLRLACDLVKQYEKRDPAELLPESLPDDFKFQSNIDYIRDILKTQMNLTSYGSDIMPFDDLPDKTRYIHFQEIVNAKGCPSETVVDELIRKTGNDYRSEIAGPYPISRYRRKEAVAAVQKRIQELQA
jgi:hypothetical protein